MYTEPHLAFLMATMIMKRRAISTWQAEEEQYSSPSHPPFDIVILDYRMPNKDGLAAAIEILELCPSQRIMFASAYTAKTLVAAVKNLHRLVELLHKPFELEYFVDGVEDTMLYE
jgi:CheY-like chemotaxis protein